MIKVAYLNVEDLNLNKSYDLLSELRKRKVNSYRFMKDKKLSAGAYLLLKKLLNDSGIHNPVFKIEKYGKAYISNYQNIHFNLSHSNKIVACALSDKQVGIDVEYYDSSIDLNIAKHYFFNEEYEKIISSPKPEEEFFNYWVLKESYMKYTGLGFNLNLDSFCIIKDNKIKLKNNNKLNFNLFSIKQYKLAVCSHYNSVNLIKHVVDDLY